MAKGGFVTIPVRTLEADPPWPFDDALPGGRGASSHYACLSIDEIAGFLDRPLELPRYGRTTVREILAPDAVLFLWRVHARQRDALDVAEAWGFRVLQEVVWEKITADGTGLRMGMGRWLRSCHETALVGFRGRRPPPRDRGVLDVVRAPRGRHSAKPEAFYELVERVADGPYLSLFARSRRRGWVQHGLELEGGMDASQRR